MTVVYNRPFFGIFTMQNFFYCFLNFLLVYFLSHSSFPSIFFPGQMCIYWASFIFYMWYYILITFSLITLVSFSKAVCSNILLILLLILFVCFSFHTQFDFIFFSELSNLLFRFFPYITFSCVSLIFGILNYSQFLESQGCFYENKFLFALNPPSCPENPTQIMSWTYQKEPQIMHLAQL